jgi:hypothetical protein
MKTSLSTYALLAGIAALAVAGIVFHYGLPTFSSTAKTLRCKITITSTDSSVWKGVVQTFPAPTQHFTVIYRIDGDQWKGLVDGMDLATMVRQTNAEFDMHEDVPPPGQTFSVKTTDQTYVLWDKISPDHTDFLSIDRTTGDVSGSSYSVTGGTTFRDVTTGHCTPVTGTLL